MYIINKRGIHLNCEYCNIEIYKTQTNYNRQKHHFCSQECANKYKHDLTYEDRKCEFCGELFHVRKKYQQRFCNTFCQNEWQKTRTGILNPRFTSMKIACYSCGKEYYEKYYAATDGRLNFCSPECRQKWFAEVHSQTDEYKNKSRIRAIEMLENGNFNHTMTNIQKIINDLLDSMNIRYINEKSYKYYTVDNYLIDNDLIIEVMGDYWHSNPNKYQIFDKLNKTQLQRITKDKTKSTYINNYFNIKILYIWEYDIHNNIEMCKKLIDLYINDNGDISNYNSFNYHIENDALKLNDNIVLPYHEKSKSLCD